MTTLNTLRSARLLLADPRRWCKYTSACDEHFNPVSPWSPNAVQWSLIGALHREGTDFSAAHAAVSHHVANGYVAIFEDEATHQQILDVLDRAIAVEKEKAPKKQRRGPT